MESVKTLIVGAGVSGLATAAFLKDRDLLVLETEAEIGGYCRTVKKDGFTWDYSGHFFHFKHPEIEQWLRERMAGQRIRTVTKRSFIRYAERLIDFPFQKNIHQLPQDEFIECLYDLYFADQQQKPAEDEQSFQQMLYARFGRGICEKFLIPYNEKLYACDLGTLDQHAMGRFFPHANLTEIVRNMREPDNASYNATFTYPEGGAIEYVNALASEVPSSQLALSEPVVAIDLERRVARTPKRELRFERLVSSAPFPRLLQLTGIAHDPAAFSWNKVLVFNLGFDRKGPRDVHWVYYPDRACVFYRVGFYDNIFDADRLSLYVEIGFPRDGKPDVEALRARVLEDLKKVGVIDDHQLVASHSVLMDPAYVHITRQSMAEHARLAGVLRERGAHSIGRYGRWTYCSIEDNVLEARALAEKLDGSARFFP
ncbi:MAG: FAD-dependent oxidoreductase [Myxococcaceae bacterium]